MRIYFLSMGCAKNTADSEHLTSQLQQNGHSLTSLPEDADIAIINTCGFIQDAVKENIDAIIDLEYLKQSGKLKQLIVVGCLVNRYEKDLRKEFAKTVDLFARSEEWEKVIAFLGGRFNANCEAISPPLNNQFWTRYLKVAEGCNTQCSYCTIPAIRGRLRSIPLEQLVDEARMLCIAGAKELCLVAQDLTVYGQDIGTDLRELLRVLNAELPSGTWLRLLYLHPNRVDERLIDFLLTQEKVLHYLDIPIQHADPKILERMNRPVPEGHLNRIFAYIREQDPLFTLRTTIMTGFPGETSNSFSKLLDFVSEVEFDRLGVFVYSPESGTKAVRFGSRVPRKTGEARCSMLMELQAQIAHDRSELFVERELDVLIDEADDEVVGRSYRDAPEVDGVVVLTGRAEGVKRGEIVRAKIHDCSENDLFGEVI